jgi:hypothetical protein
VARGRAWFRVSPPLIVCHHLFYGSRVPGSYLPPNPIVCEPLEKGPRGYWVTVVAYGVGRADTGVVWLCGQLCQGREPQEAGGEEEERSQEGPGANWRRCCQDGEDGWRCDPARSLLCPWQEVYKVNLRRCAGTGICFGSIYKQEPNKTRHGSVCACRARSTAKRCIHCTRPRIYIRRHMHPLHSTAKRVFIRERECCPRATEAREKVRPIRAQPSS